jgi:hypothetical protein
MSAVRFNPTYKITAAEEAADKPAAEDPDRFLLPNFEVKFVTLQVNIIAHSLLLRRRLLFGQVVIM